MAKILLVVVLYLCWREIIAGNADADELEFWKPNDMEYRRNVKSVTRKRHPMVKKTRSSKAHFKKIRFRHSYPNDELDIWDPDVRYGRRSGLKGPVKDSTSKKQTITKTNSTNNTSESNTTNLMFRASSTKKVTKSNRQQNIASTQGLYRRPEVVQRSRFRTRTALRSTRLTMGLMQQTDDATLPSTRLTDKPPELKVVEVTLMNPYAINQQLHDILKEFSKHANITQLVIGRTAEYKDIVLLKITEKKEEEKEKDKGKDNKEGEGVGGAEGGGGGEGGGEGAGVGEGGKKGDDTFFRTATEESKYMDEVPEKKIIFIVHGLSVMGWNKVDCLSQIIDFKDLMSYYLEHLPKFDIFVIPMANPDGVTNTVTAAWNKNNSPQSACPGVALDRNFDVMWNSSKITSSCSPAYPGPRPFSEPESQAVRDIFHYYGHKIYAYIHVHAGTHSPKVFKGDAVLYPKGYSNYQADEDRYVDLKAEIEEVMKNASFQVYSVTVDSLYNWYGKVAGSSVDYASTVYGIPFALEFAMQPYEDVYGYYALTVSWSRIVDVVFDNMWKHLQKSYDKDISMGK